MDKVTRQCPRTTTFSEEKGEPKRYRTEVLVSLCVCVINCANLQAFVSAPDSYRIVPTVGIWMLKSHQPQRVASGRNACRQLNSWTRRNDTPPTPGRRQQAVNCCLTSCALSPPSRELRSSSDSRTLRNPHDKSKAFGHRFVS